MATGEVSNNDLARMIADGFASTEERFAAIDRRFVAIEEQIVTKKDAEIFATKDDLRSLATKDDLRAMEERLTEKLDREQQFSSDAFDNHEKRIHRTEDVLGLPPIMMKTRDAE